MLAKSNAYAGFLLTDPNPGIVTRGDTAFDTTISTLSMHGAVDYAVYLPGSFNGTYGLGADPSNGTQFVYAYQLFNLGSASDRTVGALSVGLDNGPPVFSIETLPHAFGNFGLDPFITNTRFEPPGGPFSSARWAYSPGPPNNIPELNSLEASQILLYTSPFGPQFTSATVSGGGLSKTVAQSLPSPVPEPATGLIILIVGLAALTARATR
jgi:hypothetical protein